MEGNDLSAAREPASSYKFIKSIDPWATLRPAGELQCKMAAIVSAEEFEELTAKKVSGGERDAAF